MECKNYFCLYGSDSICSFDSISLNIQGTCQACITVPIREDILLQAKKELLKRYGESD